MTPADVLELFSRMDTIHSDGVEMKILLSLCIGVVLFSSVIKGWKH